MHRSSLVVCLSLLSACGVTGGTTRLGTISRTPASSFQSLDKRVSAEACSQPLSTDDYRRAAMAAIAQAPGANALSDVLMESRETMTGGFCLRVSGLAGVIR
jgi:hypothetical protein